jgi:hypothetical protein
MKRTPLKRKTPLKRAVWGQKSLRTNAKRKKAPPSISKLKKQADAVFSLWIRNRDGGRCFTCGVQKPIKEMQNGHYVSRMHSSLRYDERNCNCQCVGCNVFKHGNMDEYTLALTRLYGIGILDDIAHKKREIKQLTRQDLERIIEKYAV